MRELILKPSNFEIIGAFLQQNRINNIDFSVIPIRTKDGIKDDQNAREFWDLMLFDLKNSLSDADKGFLQKYVIPVTYVNEILKVRILDASLKDAFKQMKVIYRYFEEQNILLGLIF